MATTTSPYLQPVVPSTLGSSKQISVCGVVNASNFANPTPAVEDIITYGVPLSAP